MIDDFKLIVVNPSPKLTDQEMRSIATSFGFASPDQGIETNSKRILTRVLKHWNKKESSAHPNTCALTSDETVALNIYSSEIK